MAGSPPNFYKMDSRSACIEGVLKVKVKVTWYGHFCAGTKIASSPRQMARSRPNLHTMVKTCIQGVLKVKVKGHVIRALSWILGMSYSVINGLVPV